VFVAYLMILLTAYILKHWWLVELKDMEENSHGLI
jgi:hypothetical protein